MSSREILRITHRGGRNYTFNNRGTSPALQDTSLSQGHQSWFPPSPHSAPEQDPVQCGKPPSCRHSHMETTSGLAPGLAGGHFSTKGLVAIFTPCSDTPRVRCSADKCSGKLCCSARPGLSSGTMVVAAVHAGHAGSPRPGTRVFPGGTRKLHPCSLTPT